VVRLDEGDSLVSHTLCRHQAIFLESWTDRVVVGRHTDVRCCHHRCVLDLVGELFKGLYKEEQLVERPWSWAIITHAAGRNRFHLRTGSNRSSARHSLQAEM
jgi:hypothetical protein